MAVEERALLSTIEEFDLLITLLDDFKIHVTIDHRGI